MVALAGGDKSKFTRSGTTTDTDGEWRCMMLVALRAGLRHGELLALRWEDVDLKKGLLCVRQSVTRGHVTEPKSGKGRDVPLSDDALAAFKAQRHLRGPLVFSAEDGRMLVKTECRHPLWRASKKGHLSPNVPSDAVKALDSGVALTWHNSANLADAMPQASVIN